MTFSYEVELPLPWDRESAFTRHLLVDQDVNGKARFHLVDPWHMLHLGIGKAFGAAGLMLLQQLVCESTVDKRFAFISAEYRQYCRRTKRDPIIRKLDIHSVGGGGCQEQNGSWNKAAVTTNILMFLQDYIERNGDTVLQTEQLRIFVSKLHWTWDLFVCSLFVGDAFKGIKGYMFPEQRTSI